MIKTFFYIKKDKQNSKGEVCIFAKIKLEGKSATLSTGKFISSERWHFTNKLKNTLKLTHEKNIRITLDLIERKVEETYYELAKVSNKVTVNDIKKKIKGKSNDSDNDLDILKLFELHNDNFEKKYKAGERSKASLQKYNRAKDLLTNFIFERHQKTSFPINDIDNQFVFDLVSFLRYESTFNNKIGISHNSVVKYFQTFKTVCRFGINRNLTNRNPFSIYDEKLVIKDAVFLTKKELESIEEKEFSTERLNKVKDIFLFSCYTGYAPCDVENLTRENLIEDNDHTLWIKTNRAKTNIKSNVPLIPPAKRIIEKYDHLQERLLPRISNQKINEYLKEIGELCRINKKLTHYVARHTFATTVTLGNGIGIENVSKMMGHTRITMTQHYAKVLDSNVKKDMDKLNRIYC